MITKINNSFDIDLLYELFLKNTNNVIGMVNKVNNYLDDNINFIYGDLKCLNLPNNIFSMNDIINLINQKSEICEVCGYKEYIEEVKKSIETEDIKTKIYLPLSINNVVMFIQLSIYHLYDKNITFFVFNNYENDRGNIENLYHFSYKDSLTGLFNFNACQFHFKKVSNVEHFIGFMDLDRFKTINDMYGHAVGDEILSMVGKKLIDICDNNIIMYRKGGDEFIFMIQNLDYDSTMALTKKISKEISKINYLDQTISASIGLVKFDYHIMKDRNEALILSDIAMYMAKESKRGSIVYLDEDNVKRIIDSGLETYLEKTEHHYLINKE